MAEREQVGPAGQRLTTPAPAGKGLVEGKVGFFLTYPLTNRNARRFPPVGGLFATAADVARPSGGWSWAAGCSRASARRRRRPCGEMTSTQTGKLLDKDKGEGGYGLGFSTTCRSAGASAPAAEASPLGGCGHGGACATDFWVDPQQQTVTVYMVQNQGYGGPDGGKILPTFR